MIEIDPEFIQMVLAVLVSIAGSVALSWRFLIQKATASDANERKRIGVLDADLAQLKADYIAQAHQIEKLIEANIVKDQKIKSLEDDLFEWKLKYAALESSKDTLQSIFNTVLEQSIAVAARLQPQSNS